MLDDDEFVRNHKTIMVHQLADLLKVSECMRRGLPFDGTLNDYAQFSTLVCA